MTTPWPRPSVWYEAYLFDLDGTLFLGDQLLPGAQELLERLRKRRLPIRFLSNNATFSPADVVSKLTGLGIAAEPADVINTVVTTVNWLSQHHPDVVLFPIAERPLVSALQEAGFQLSADPSRIDIVIASYDRGFNYAKLQIAYDAIAYHRRAFLVQTNPDRFCPFPGGRGEPDCAAITAAIEACTATRVRHNFGKPDPIMLDAALASLPKPTTRAVMVGDRLHTDIAMANAAGLDSALVLSGDSGPADLEAAQPGQLPTWVLDRIDQLIPSGH